MQGDVTYLCDIDSSTDKLLVNLGEAQHMYIAIICAGMHLAIVLAKADALDLARRINEAFGDSNA